jgi:hypothetical protein
MRVLMRVFMRVPARNEKTLAPAPKRIKPRFVTFGNGYTPKTSRKRRPVAERRGPWGFVPSTDAETSDDACPQPVRCTRRRIWELETGSHCAVIGTCLTVDDLRTLARKLKLKLKLTPAKGIPLDYELHGYFAHAACERNWASKLLTKLLDRLHAGSTRDLKGVSSAEGLLSRWSAAWESGDIPGAFWAILSHTAVTGALAGRLFADVHMLSHVTGASNRADIHRLNALEQRNRELHDEIAARRRRHSDRLDDRDRTIAELTAEVAGLRGQLASVRLEASDAPGADRLVALEAEVTAATARAEKAETTVAALSERIAVLNTRIDRQSQEVRVLEEAHFPGPDAAEPGVLDLVGAAVLYVGGRIARRPFHRYAAILRHAGLFIRGRTVRPHATEQLPARRRRAMAAATVH